MTTVTRPFDLADAKRGTKVQTADGRRARILCYDFIHPVTPLLVAVMNDEVGGEEVFLYAANGRRDMKDRSSDLVMYVTRHEGWICIYAGIPPYTSTLIYNSEKDARDATERLEAPCTVVPLVWYE